MNKYMQSSREVRQNGKGEEAFARITPRAEAGEPDVMARVDFLQPDSPTIPIDFPFFRVKETLLAAYTHQSRTEYRKRSYYFHPCHK